MTYSVAIFSLQAAIFDQGVLTLLFKHKMYYQFNNKTKYLQIIIAWFVL